MCTSCSRILLLTLTIGVFAGCGRAPQPTPTPTATLSPTIEVNTDGQNDDQAGGQILSTLEPVNATPVADVVAAAESSAEQTTIAHTPVVEDTRDCALQSDLDLAGYPNLEEIMGCALAPARADPVGFNEFGEGPDYTRFMLWLSWEDQIYVLAPNGAWQAYPDTWSEDDPTFSCNPLGGEPTSPPLPRRGFGKLWCENAGVRDALGMVEVQERLCQHAVIQEFENGRVIACFEDATIRYYKLFNDRSWEAVLQP